MVANLISRQDNESRVIDISQKRKKKVIDFQRGNYYLRTIKSTLKIEGYHNATIIHPVCHILRLQLIAVHSLLATTKGKKIVF